jgi:hypothetical protein
LPDLSIHINISTAIVTPVVNMPMMNFADRIGNDGDACVSIIADSVGKS